MIRSIWEGKLAKRRYHNAIAISLWVQHGRIPPRKEAVLKSVLFTLREQCRNLADKGV